MKLETSEKNVAEFVSLLCSLELPEFIGVLTLMGVPYRSEEDEKKKRPLPDILSDVMDKYALLSRKPRRRLLQLINNSLRQSKKSRPS